MGSVLSLLKKWKQPTVPEDDASIDKAVLYLVDQPDDLPNSNENYMAIRTISLHLLRNGVTGLRPDGKLYINRVLLGLLSTGKFKSFAKKLFKHLLTVNTQVNTKNILLVKVFDIHYLEALAKLLLMLSENRSLKILENLSQYKFEENTAAFLETANIPEKDHASMFPLENFIEQQAKTECQAAYLTLRDTLSGFLKLKTSFLTRSDNTLDSLSLLAEHTFVLLVRIYFHRQHHQTMRKFVLDEHSQSAVKFGAYFLATSVQNCKTGLYNLTVKFLTSLLYDGQTSKAIVSFPSHMFVHLPLLMLNTVYQFILCNVLKGLSRVFREEGENKRYESYMQINRYESWRLVLYLLENQQAKFGEISLNMLEELCRTVKISDIERIYVNRMIRMALKIVKSEFLLKFHKMEKVAYQLNIPNNTVTLSGEQIFSFLEDFLSSLPQGVPYDFEHYLYESIFQHKVEPAWTEQSLWAIVRHKIEHPHNKKSSKVNGIKKHLAELENNSEAEFREAEEAKE